MLVGFFLRGFYYYCLYDLNKFLVFLNIIFFIIKMGVFVFICLGVW